MTCKFTFINYADCKFKKSQNFALRAAKIFGGFDNVYGYGKINIDKKFYDKYKSILNAKRGGGYWLWKAYVVREALKNLKDGDILFYCDSGGFFVKSVAILNDVLIKSGQSVMGFELPLIEEQWTKGELFKAMDCDQEFYRHSNQIMSTLFMLKKDSTSIRFIEDYYNYCCDKINITDDNISGFIQSNIFIDHRHDQSVFSLLYKKYGFIPFKDPTQRGSNPLSYSGELINNRIYFEGWYKFSNGRLLNIKRYSENYNSIIFLHKSNKPFFNFFKYLIKKFITIND
jgi:hypothetical protein